MIEQNEIVYSNLEEEDIKNASLWLLRLGRIDKTLLIFQDGVFDAAENEAFESREKVSEVIMRWADEWINYNL